MIVGQTSKVHLFCIVLTPVLAALEERGIAATKGIQHGMVHMIEDESRFIYFALCCIVTSLRVLAA